MLTLLIAALACSGAACASTILKYPAPDVQKQREAMALPPSAFHAAEGAQGEAKRIILAWQEGKPVTIPWTQVQLARFVKHKMIPTRGARGLALMHVALHDAMEAAREKKLDERLATSMAAAQVLGYLFFVEEKAFDRIALAAAEQVTGAKANALPQAAQDALVLGRHIGERVVQHGDTDGAQKGWNGVRLQYYGENRYYGPGTWEPTPPYFYYPPDEPFAPSWRTWALSSANEFRPVPPAYGSERFRKDLEEVMAIASRLTDDERHEARFWVDGHGSVTPPGHWNNIAIDEVVAAKLDSLATARLFAHINIAMADTFIAVWETKYHYWTARPITAARYVFGENFRPLLLTPPFPSYVSGHAGFSGAAGKVLGAYLPARAAKMDELLSLSLVKPHG